MEIGNPNVIYIYLKRRMDRPMAEYIGKAEGDDVYATVKDFLEKNPVPTNSIIIATRAGRNRLEKPNVFIYKAKTKKVELVYGPDDF